MTKIGWQHDEAARRPPKHGKTMTGAERRLLYAKTRRRDMTDVIYALKDALSGRANRTAFIAVDRGVISRNTAGANAPFIGRS